MSQLLPHDALAHVPAAVSGAYPARTGNLVRPLVDGLPAFRRIAEAVASAQHSVWLTVAFYAHDFRFPNESGETLFDLLDHATGRGLDVRVLFLRQNGKSAADGHTFSGTRADFDLLRARGSQFGIRWDQAQAAFCQHQKSRIIDAGRTSETAFIGGIGPVRDRRASQLCPALE